MKSKCLAPFIPFSFQSRGREAWGENQIESIKMITSFHGPCYLKFSSPHFTSRPRVKSFIRVFDTHFEKGFLSMTRNKQMVILG